MPKVIRSVCLDPEVVFTLKEMDVNISDMANNLLSSWIRHIKEEKLMEKVFDDASINHFVTLIKKKVYEK